MRLDSILTLVVEMLLGRRNGLLLDLALIIK